MHDEKELLVYVDRMIVGAPSRIYVRLDFDCVYSEMVKKTQERIMDRMYDLGKEGMIQTAFKEKRRIIDILVTE